MRHWGHLCVLCNRLWVYYDCVNEEGGCNKANIICPECSKVGPAYHYPPAWFHFLDPVEYIIASSIEVDGEWP